jgi:hypothetical protein
MLWSLVAFAIIYPVIAKDGHLLFNAIIITWIDFAVANLLFIGLHRMTLWGWRLNWVVLALEVLLRPLDRAESLSHYLLFAIAGFFLWFIPNAIYFKKRRHLFS